MERVRLPLSVHGEMPGDAWDIFDREEIFIDTVAPVIIRRHPRLKIIFEHISTERSVQLMNDHRDNPLIWATVTGQHMTYTRNDMLAGGMRPDLFCFPVLQRKEDRDAVYGLAISDHPHVCLGTDSAYHVPSKKYSPCAPGGVYVEHPMDLYIKGFWHAGCIERLEEFAVVRPAELYGWERTGKEVEFALNYDEMFAVVR
jgi:dihydroorotase